MAKRSTHSRTRATSFVGALFALALLLDTSHADADTDKVKAREHFEQAEMFMNTGVYDEAIKEYERAYEFAPTAHGFLFNIGLAYEKWGKLRKAVDFYADYLEEKPSGKKAKEAKARMIAIERKLELEEPKAKPEPKPKKKTEPRKPTLDVSEDMPAKKKPRPDLVIEEPTPERPPGNGRSAGEWAMIGVGAALLAGGIVFDLSPESSRNGVFDGQDVVPVGLYAAGAGLLIVGIF